MAIPLNSTIIQQAGGAVLTTTAPSPIGASNVTGVATTAARADHVHAHGQQGGGLSHPEVSATDRGFMTPAMLTRLNNTSPSYTTLRITSAADASPTSTDHGFQVGPDGANVRIDTNEVMAIASGAPSPLYINHDGGTVFINQQVAYHGGNYTSIPLATTALPGLMSAADKVKLDAGGGGGSGPPLATTAPPGIATSSTTGTGSSAARNDHTHGHGNQGGGAQHSAATSSANGFMPAADKAKLDAATTANVANTIVMRNAEQRISANMFSSGASASTGYFISTRQMFASGSGIGFNVACTGPSFTPTSDIRLKTDFANILDHDALIRLMQIEPLEYTRLQDGVRARGFGAQGLGEIDPLYVVGDELIFDEIMDEDGATVVTPSLDETGVQRRTPLGVDPVAILADVIAALRSHEVRIGSLELQTASAANPA